MAKRFKLAVVMFSIMQIRKLLTLLNKEDVIKDREAMKIVRHLQGVLYDYTGCWWV